MVALVAVAAGDQAFAVAGNTADPAYGYVVKVTVGSNRSCTGVLLANQMVATSRECFKIGSTLPVAGPPPVASIATPRSDQYASITRATIDYLIPRDDRNLVLAHLTAPGLILWRGPAKITTTAPAAGETLRVLGFGRTADQWVPDLPHTAQLAVQDVAATGLGIAPADAGGAICKGDAGGPVVRDNGDGTSTLVALINTSWQGGCLGETGTRRDATATRVDDLAGWIGQFQVTSINGTVEAGAENGCLILRDGGQTYNLAGYDSSIVKVGARVHLTGFQAPDANSTCMQGVRFQVTAATPILTVGGTVTKGVEVGCLRLAQYNLVGGDRTVLKVGARVQVTGYVDTGTVGFCDGTPLRVLTAAATG
jgi:hypothetical protein